MSLPAACLCVAWVAVVLGLLGGAAIGLGFAGDAWLGGYQSWRRRLLRLAHIACVGTGLLCGAYGVTAATLDCGSWWIVGAFVVGVVSMPSVCAAAAWRQPLRHLFIIPVLALVTASCGAVVEVFACLSLS